MSINIGDIRRVSVSFQTSTSVYLDPTTITAKIEDPSANVETFVYGTDAEVIKDDTGQYHLDITLDESGDWYYQWAGTGTVVAMEEGFFNVEHSEVP